MRTASIGVSFRAAKTPNTIGCPVRSNHACPRSRRTSSGSDFARSRALSPISNAPSHRSSIESRSGPISTGRGSRPRSLRRNLRSATEEDESVGKAISLISSNGRFPKTKTLPTSPFEQIPISGTRANSSWCFAKSAAGIGARTQSRRRR